VSEIAASATRVLASQLGMSTLTPILPGARWRRKSTPEFVYRIDGVLSCPEHDTRLVGLFADPRLPRQDNHLTVVEEEFRRKFEPVDAGLPVSVTGEFTAVPAPILARLLSALRDDDAAGTRKAEAALLEAMSGAW